MIDAGGSRADIFVVPWLFVAMLAACDSGTTAGSADSATEILARVNGDKITIRQFKDQLTLMRRGPDVDAKVLAKQILQSLVDEQLLVQRALADKLDKDPSAMRAIERSRRQILAQAAIDHAGGNMEITTEEARKFYAEFPDLFKKRKIYTFRQFVLDVVHLDESLKGRLDRAKTPAEVIALVTGAGIKFRYQTEMRAAETLPLEILERAAGMTSGDILVLGNAGRIVLMQLVNEVLEPIDIVQAMPSIRTYLASGRKIELAESLLKDLRRKASIEYAGGLSDPSGALAAKMAAQALVSAEAAGDENSIRKSNKKISDQW